MNLKWTNLIFLRFSGGHQNQFCLTEELKLAQDVFGILSLANFDKIVQKATGLEKPPKNIVCTNCVKQGYNIYKKELPEVVSNLETSLQNTCGADFTGTISSEVP